MSCILCVVREIALGRKDRAHVAVQGAASFVVAAVHEFGYERVHDTLCTTHKDAYDKGEALFIQTIKEVME